MDTSAQNVDGGKPRPWFKRITIVGVLLFGIANVGMEAAEFFGWVTPGTSSESGLLKTSLDLLESLGISFIIVGFYRQISDK